MFKRIITNSLIFSSSLFFGQVSGNANYQNSINFPENYTELSFPKDGSHTIRVKALANLKADNYIAIFGITQSGKTTDEVNQLLNERINQISESLKSLSGVEFYVDMISLVPSYEYETDKKIFSKKTYNEVPSEFELKKNIHVKFNNANTLNQIINIMSKNEVYDLAKVDYHSSVIDSIKKELATKSKTLLQEKIKNYESILGETFASENKLLAEGFQIVFPLEQYKSYQAYSSNSTNIKRGGIVNHAAKSTTQYYQPITEKGFDIVINPIVLEPVIQVVYEISLKIEKIPSKSNKEYLLVTPNGEIKSLTLK